jgi:hypothetical protein
MVIAGTAGDPVDMHDRTVTAPGDLTRNRHERLLAERLHQELALLTMISRPEVSDRVREARQAGGEIADNPDLIDALEDEAQLEHRIRLLHLAWSHQSAGRD